MAMSTKISLGEKYSAYPLEEIGSGRFGVVCHGDDTDGRHLAVKRLFCKSGNEEKKQDLIKTYLKDIISKDCFNAEHVLQYLHYFCEEDGSSGTHWLVMDYCQEGNLCEYLKKYQIYSDEKKILSVMIQSTDGVSALHSCNPSIIHRQIKPQNILIKSEGQKHVVKISDYAMTQLFEGTDGSTTYSGGGVFRETKPSDFFKGPEYFATSTYPNKASYDVFCLGLVFLTLTEYAGESDKMIPTYKDYPQTPIAQLMIGQKAGSDTLKLFENERVEHNGMQTVIEDMLHLDEQKRPNTPKVMEELKEIQAKYYPEVEVGPIKASDESPLPSSCDEVTAFTNVSTSNDSDIIQKVYKGFEELIKEKGPLDYKDRIVRSHFVQLSDEEMDVVLAKGSIRDFLISFGSIQIEDNILKYADHTPSPVGKLHDNTTATNSREQMKKHYLSLNKKLEVEENKKLAQQVKSIYNSSKDGMIYVCVSKEAFDLVDQQLKSFEEYPFLKVIVQEQVKSEWLVNPEYETQTPTLLSCIGPGSLLANDPDLVKFKEMEQLEKNLYVVESAFMEKAWGSFGCLVVDKDDVYVLSAKHILKQNGNDANNKIDIDHTSETCMITALKDDHEFNVTEASRVQSQIKDCLYISKGFQGILDVETKVGDPHPKLIDVAVFGPLHKSFLSIHEAISSIEAESFKLAIMREPHYMLDGLLVKKVGATTGMTKGIVIVSSYEYSKTVSIHDGSRRNITGRTFLVTSYNDEKQPKRDGSFALKGDSGSIVLLDDPQRPGMHAVGIVHAKIDLLKLSEYDIYNNVIVCVYLDHNIDTLVDRGHWTDDLNLFYYYFKPILCLGPQKVENDNPNLPVV